MSAARTISLTLSPEVLVRVEAIAEHQERSLSDLMDEALRRYLVGDDEWDALLKVTRAKGHEMGTLSESDVERLAGERRPSIRQGSERLNRRG